MDRNDCYKEYWEKHPDEYKTWLNTEPFLVGFQYGIQSKEFLEALKVFSPDNPIVLYGMFEHHIVCKRISEALKFIDKLKEIYPEYNEEWDLEVEYIEYIRPKINESENKKKVQDISDFINNRGREWKW